MLKNSKESIENSRNDTINELNRKFEKREAELAMGIEALQARYCKSRLKLNNINDL